MAPNYSSGSVPVLTGPCEGEAPGVAGDFPLSFCQESVWLAEQLRPGSAAYCLPEAWRLWGRLDAEVLQKAFSAMVQRHETLRTCFRNADGSPRQVILASAAAPMPIIDLSAEACPGSALATRLSAEARTPFKLNSAPLARLVLFRLGAEEHVLFYNLHHLIGDAWSQSVFLRELAEHYNAGGRASLPELAIQYADYAVWQRDSLQQGTWAKEITYWRERLANPPPAPGLPGDGPSAVKRSVQGRTEFFSFSPEFAAQLKQFSRNHGVTLFMTLLAGFKALLYRLTGQQDILVGSPFACRELPETERLIGFIVHTHALRSSAWGNPSFAEFVARIRETVLGAYTNQAVPLEAVLQTGGAPTQPPISTVFGLQTAAPENWGMRGLQVKRIELDNGGAKFDWTVLCTETADGLSLRSEYSTDLFAAGSTGRLLRAFETLLRAAIEHPEGSLADLPLLSREERQQIVSGWNQTAADYERDATVHQVFERQAAATPRTTALVFNDQRLDYGELNSRANKLARYLQRCGVGPEILVGVCLERSFELLIALLAVLKAGGAYVPLDRSYPRERLDWMLEDCAAPVLITSSHFQGRKQLSTRARIIEMDADQELWEAESDQNPASGTLPKNLAYVIYTSGSTGMPKGAAIPHRGIVRLARNTNYVQITPQDRFLQFAPVSFDASTFEMWGALLNGAQLVLHPPGTPSLEQLGRFIQQQQISVLWLTAGLFNQMVETHLEQLRGVRQLLAGGEALSVPHVLKALNTLGPGCQLINGYGPTENTTFTCCYRIPNDWPGSRSVPIGGPISNTRVFILDDRRQPLPVGIPGELYIGGDGLARGYLNQPALTAEKFVELTCLDTPERLYRTGDLVRWLPDGNIEFLGRLDDQLKVRGFRIEPGEIETVLCSHPQIRSAAVIGRQDTSGTRRLVAYVVSAVTLSSAAIREWLAGKLPPHMVPSEITLLPELPLTQNGKVDRRRLESLPGNPEQVPERHVAPRNEAEAALAIIWKELLGRNSFGVEHNFFHLGGHSLLAMQMSSRIASKFGVELPLDVIFEKPTICGLAAAIAGAGNRPPAPALKPSVSTHAAELLARLDELSDEEVERLLEHSELSS
jgi:amino acid adenylation domain-containing protein